MWEREREMAAHCWVWHPHWLTCLNGNGCCCRPQVSEYEVLVIRGICNKCIRKANQSIDHRIVERVAGIFWPTQQVLPATTDPFVGKPDNAAPVSILCVHHCWLDLCLPSVETRSTVNISRGCFCFTMVPWEVLLPQERTNDDDGMIAVRWWTRGLLLPQQSQTTL